MKCPRPSDRTEFFMSKKSVRSLALLLLVMTVALTSMTSCFAILGGSDGDYLTKEEIQQLINNSMRGDITVEGGDNINVTVNGTNQENAAAGKALLSVVSVRCMFKTTSSGTAFYPGSSASKDKTSAGSGIIYKLDKEKGDAYIVTNYHVVYYNRASTKNGISNDISVYLYGQESTEYAIPATYVGGSMSHDIAVLKVEGSRVLAESNAAPVEFANSDNVAVLDQAIAVGNPENLGISATLGYVNVDSEYIAMEGADGMTEIELRVMRIDTAVNGGNSGGGLFNSRGELIGIVNAKLTDSENMSYAIPSNLVKSVAESILYYCDGNVNENMYRCMLGIMVVPSKLYTVYDEETGKLLKREEVAVSEINSGSIVTGALHPGDIINSITVDGVEYEAIRRYIVIEAMINARVGSDVVISITREGQRIDYTVEVTERSLTLIK